MTFMDFFNPVGAWGVRGEVEPPPLVDKQAEWRDREIEKRGARIGELSALLDKREKDHLSKSAAYEAAIRNLKTEMIERGKQFDVEKSADRLKLNEHQKMIQRLRDQHAQWKSKVDVERAADRVIISNLKEELLEVQKLLGPRGVDAEKPVKLRNSIKHDKPLSYLELSTRTATCLDNMGVKTVRQLLSYKEADLLRISNFGRSSLNEVDRILAEMGLKHV